MAKASTKSNRDDLIYPIGSNYFSVKIEDIEIAFQIVSGLKARYEVVEYRSGNSKIDSNIKMPLSVSYSDVVFKKGMFKGNNSLIKWFADTSFTKVERKTITVQLLDEEGNPLFTWKLENAFPREISFGDFDAMNATYAVEEMVISHEGLKIESS